MGLKNVRKEIDSIDHEIIKLLHRRMSLAVQTSRFKKELYDPKREKKIIDKVSELAGGVLSPEFCRHLYVEIMKESKNIQKKSSPLIGVTPNTALSGKKVLKNFYGDLRLIEVNDPLELFVQLKNNATDACLISFEELSTSADSIRYLQKNHNIKLVRELKITEKLCMSLPRTMKNSIPSVVYSEPKFILAAETWIREKKIKTIPVNSLHSFITQLNKNDLSKYSILLPEGYMKTIPNIPRKMITGMGTLLARGLLFSKKKHIEKILKPCQKNKIRPRHASLIIGMNKEDDAMGKFFRKCIDMGFFVSGIKFLFEDKNDHPIYWIDIQTRYKRRTSEKELTYSSKFLSTYTFLGFYERA